jgi:hypothetical protein
MLFALFLLFTFQSVRLYDVIRNQFKFQYTQKAAVLDATFTDTFHSVSGGIDLQLKYVDLTTRHEVILGGILISVK